MTGRLEQRVGPRDGNALGFYRRGRTVAAILPTPQPSSLHTSSLALQCLQQAQAAKSMVEMLLRRRVNAGTAKDSLSLGTQGMHPSTPFPALQPVGLITDTTLRPSKAERRYGA